MRRKAVTAALYVGLVLTAIATLEPYLDRDALTGHIRAGYPEYAPARIDSAANTYLALLTVVGVLGTVGWLATARAVHRGARWIRMIATGLLVLGATVALTGLLARDTSGDTGLPPSIGWLGILPCVPGLFAVGLLWRRSADGE